MFKKLSFTLLLTITLMLISSPVSANNVFSDALNKLTGGCTIVINLNGIERFCSPIENNSLNIPTPPPKPPPSDDDIGTIDPAPGSPNCGRIPQLCNSR